MLREKRVGLIQVIGILLCGLMAGSPQAQDYPSRPVKIVVPGAPGDASDIVARLLAQKLSERMGLQLVHVPYKGATPAITDLIAGHIQLFIGNLPPILPQVQSGKLRALAVTSRRRWPELPDLPTMADSGTKLD